MMARTHLAFGALAVVLLSPYFSYGNIWRFGVLVLVGSLLPDIDHPQSKYGRILKPVSYPLSWLLGHRGFLHSLYVPGLMVGGAYLFPVLTPHLIAVAIGYCAHLISDALTVQGIKFFHPLNEIRVSGFVHTGGFLELILFLVLVGFNVIYILYYGMPFM